MVRIRGLIRGHYRPARPKVEVECDGCGDRYLRYASMAGTAHHFCSPECQKLWAARNREASFWAQVDMSAGCWLWTGALDRDGYGIFAAKPWQRAHRFSYWLHQGSLPAGLYVMHTCDVPACVNPQHLVLGTAEDNASDRDQKGRQFKGAPRPHPEKSQGERNPAAKLSVEQVRLMRERYASGSVTQRELAVTFGVSPALVSGVVAGKLWKHLA